MAKKSNNRFILVLNILWEGIVIYCKNLDTFLKYMFFPIIGQILGIFIIFAVNYLFVTNLPELIHKYPVFDNIPLVFTLLLISSFPGFMIFCKAFYDLIVAYGSLNSMVWISQGGKMKNKPLDTKAHDDVLKKRFASFVILWLLLAIITTLGIFPLFIVPFSFAVVFLVFVFQVFMLEDKISPIGAIKRSIYLVKGNYFPTLFLILLSAIITYYLIPSLFVFFSDEVNATKILATPVKTYIDVLAVPALVSAVENALSSVNISGYNISVPVKPLVEELLIGEAIVRTTIMVAVTGFLLPLRSAWFTLLYKTYDAEKTDELRKNEANK